MKEAEVLGVEFRNVVEEDHDARFSMKYNRMNEISDLVITLTPLQLYSPNTSRSKSIPNWLMELISEHSLKILPSMFFEKELHRKLNTSFY